MAQDSDVVAAPAGPAEQRRKGRWGFLLRAAISLGLLAWLLSRPETKETLRGISPTVLATVLGGVVVYGACQMLNTYKWSLVLQGMGYHVPYRDLLRMWFTGMFCSFFLPTSVGGDVVKVGLLVGCGVPASTGALSAFVGRMTGLVSMLVIGLVGSLAAGMLATEKLRLLLVFTAVFLVATVAVMVAAAAAERKWPVADKLPQFLGRPVRRLGEGVRRLAKAPRILALVMVWSFVFQLLMVGLNAWLGRPVGVHVAAVHYFWAVPVVTLGGMIPLLPGGLGGREAVAAWVFGLLGVAGKGPVWSLLWQAVVLLTSLPGGLLVVGKGLAVAKASGEESP